MTDPSQPVKILRLIARLNTGGPAIHTVLLTQGLNGGRFASQLVTGVVGRGEGDMSYYASRRGVTPLVIPDLGRDVAPLSDLRALWRIYRLFRREEPDIVHTHTAKAGVLGRVAGLLYNASRFMVCSDRRVKLVHSFHGHVFHGYFPWWKSRLLILAEHLLALFTHRIVAVSDGIRRELVDVYRICPADKATVIPLGLDFSWTEAMEHGRGILRRRHGVAREAITIGMVGRLTPVKNHALLLDAAGLLRRDDLKFVIIGDGELREDILAMVEARGLADCVRLSGWERETEMIYADLDIICLASRNEGTPVVLLEAMAAGRPFVATRVGGVPDVMVGPATPHPLGFEVFANGILVPPAQPAPLATALEFLADRADLRRSMGACGRASVLTRFSKERLVSDVATMYETLLGHAAGQGACAR